ncbi:glycosyltransferase [Candidatus Pelagibacter communis]|uniref:glycosyltransferase n=1 Tax=Pelagibacter ubique TaxID=198252 RepID=UPI00094C3BFC|nr:glycosyltransferase [Candidatus Pelagibacter ubique]
MYSLDNITVIIVTYLTKKQLLINCLKSIDKRVKIKIIENSHTFEHKDEILSNFPNVDINCTGENLGYGKGNNFGLKSTKTDYALILNPDVTCDVNFFSNITKVLEHAKDFTIIGCQYLNDKIFLPAGFFDNKKNKMFVNTFKNQKIEKLEKVEWVTGCSMLMNLNKFENKEIFDKNFFLFFEEFDLCKSIIKKGENIYTSKDLKIDHLGFQSSLGQNLENKSRANRIREWHWMWSSFYFYKKNYSYSKAVLKMSGKFIKSFFKFNYYFLTFQKENKEKYFYRFLGILNGMLGRSSFFRDKK